MEELARLIHERDPAVARDLVFVIDQWDAIRRSSAGDDEAWDAEAADRAERLRPLRNELDQRAF